jgi:hypothetical protein
MQIEYCNGCGTRITASQLGQDAWHVDGELLCQKCVEKRGIDPHGSGLRRPMRNSQTMLPIGQAQRGRSHSGIRNPASRIRFQSSSGTKSAIRRPSSSSSRMRTPSGSRAVPPRRKARYAGRQGRNGRPGQVWMNYLLAGLGATLLVGMGIAIWLLRG